MVDYYTNEEIWIIISVIYIISLIASIIYFLYYIDCKKINIVLLIICIIYMSLFFFLNLIASLDLVFCKDKGFSNLMNVITKFYSNFNLISYIISLFLLNVIIFYLESGYFTFYKRILDLIFRIKNKYLKNISWKIIIFSIIGVVLFAGLLTLLIIYKYDLKIENGKIFICSLLNLYTVFGIYINVGFFVVQIFKDCKREKSSILSDKYYIYSKKKIILETEKCVEKIKKKYNDLYENVPLSELIEKKGKKTPYLNYLLNIYNDFNETIKLFDSEDNNKDIKNIKNNDKNNINNTNNIITYNTTLGNNINSEERKNLSTKKVADNKSKNKIIDIEDENQNQEFIRKFKKTKRKLYKMKRLYKDIEVDKENLSKKCCCIFCYFKYVILFFVLIMVFLSDFLFPFFYIPNSDSSSFEDSSSYDKEDSIGELILAVLECIPFVFFLCSFYTIVVILSTTRSRYITGDILSGKNANDNISLIKTTNLISGSDFVLVYCNCYMYKILDNKIFGTPKFYDEVIIPDYKIKNNIGIFMIVKFILIIIFAILTCCKEKCFFFKNDLAEYNRKYTDENIINYLNEFIKILEEKKKYVIFLKDTNNNNQ